MSGCTLEDFLQTCSRPELTWLTRELNLRVRRSNPSHQSSINPSPDSTAQDASKDALSMSAGSETVYPSQAVESVSLDVQSMRVDVQERSISSPASQTNVETALAQFIATLLARSSSPLQHISKTFRTRFRLSADHLVKGVLADLDKTLVPRVHTMVVALLQSQLPAAAILHHHLFDQQSTSNGHTNGHANGHMPKAQVYHRSAPKPLSTAELAKRTISLVMPAAGRSSRFPNMKPKWQLTQPSGRLMFVDGMSGLDFSQVKAVYVGLLQEHVEKFCGNDIDAIFSTFDAGIDALQHIDVHLVVIPYETRDQVETLEWIIKAGQISGPVVIKDCDNDFVCPLEPVDGVAILEIVRENEDYVYNVASKAFVGLSPSGNVINSIVEKKIISPFICIGAYAFKDIQQALDTITDCRKLLAISKSDSELAVSDVFWAKLLAGDDIKPLIASNYQDWGTLPAWQRYCSSFKTLFVDIDGTLMKNSGEYFAPRWGSTESLPANVEHIRKMHQSGRVKVILTTSRTEAFREATLKQLAKAGCPYDQVLFGLQHSQRVVVNDFAPTNPFPSAQAVNIVRNGETLSAMLPYA